MAEILIFTPTFNESGNIQELVRQIYALGLDADMLVVDDGSPDGTGQLVETMKTQYGGLSLIQRGSKQGIGGAHLLALRYAKERGYRQLVSLDADFSHRPADIPRLLAASSEHDIVVGTRFAREDSLSEWNSFRKGVTHVGHFLTRMLLRIPYDASGGLRVYNLNHIPVQLVAAITSRDYEFFFESLTLMHLYGLSIGEVPIVLPARTVGHSKMQLGHAVRGIGRLLTLAVKLAFARRRMRERMAAEAERPDARAMEEAWNTYWKDKDHDRVERSTYDVFARFYRNYLIKPTLNRTIQGHFSPGTHLLHAGCGGGEVDADIVKYASITALDISPNALALYRKRNGETAETIVGDIFDLSELQGRFEGIYNLGVMEHFSEEQIRMILGQFNRCLGTGGKIVLFWPPVYGLSVIALRAIHFVLNRILRRNIALHPPEPTKVRSRRQVGELLQARGFRLEQMSFGIRDAFTYVVVVATKRQEFTLNESLSAAA
jgi:glycosyltransferase involved in cell wall biosynthesis